MSLEPPTPPRSTPSEAPLGLGTWGYSAVVLVTASIVVPWIWPLLSTPREPATKSENSGANTGPTKQGGASSNHEALSHLTAGVQNLMGQYDRAREQNIPDAEIPGHLEDFLHSTFGAAMNPWNRSQPAYDSQIGGVTGMDFESMRRTVESKALIPGQTVFVIQLPNPGQPGFLAGAVRLQDPKELALVHSKVMRLD